MNNQVEKDNEEKLELPHLIHINKELLHEESEFSISKCLGPMMLIGIILWLLIFSFVNYLV